MLDPVTSLTDFGLAFLGWWFAWKLSRTEGAGEWSRRLWAWGLGVQGTAAFAGAMFHGFFPDVDTTLGGAIWLLTMVLLAVATTLLVSGLALATIPPRPARLFIAVMILKLAAYIVWVWPRQDFMPALCDQALALVLIGLLSIWGRLRIRSAVPSIAFGLVALVIGGVIQHSRLGFGRYLDHNDLYHLFAGLSIWFFYCAGRGLIDSRESLPLRKC